MFRIETQPNGWNAFHPANPVHPVKAFEFHTSRQLVLILRRE